MKMRNGIAILLLASAIAGCSTPQVDQPSRGLMAVNQPVVTRSDYAVDLSAPDGSLSPGEQARLDSWYTSPGKYGLLVSRGSPVTAGNIQPGAVRVVVTRTRATVPGCPNWDRPASPDFDNQQMSNYGCAISGNFAAMVAHPGDLVHGREGEALVDGLTASKAIQSYRTAKPTGDGGLQEINTKKGGK
jgi:pilus assembly protein CpaD